MSAFTFSLEAVLTVRYREEETAKRHWALAVQAQARAAEALSAAREDLEKYNRLLAEQRKDRFRLGDQQLFFGAMAALKTLCDQLADKLAKAVAITKKQHAVLLVARMKHEVLKRLKQKKMEEHEQAIRAKEEAAVADLVISRYATRRNSR